MAPVSMIQALLGTKLAEPEKCVTIIPDEEGIMEDVVLILGKCSVDPFGK